MTAKKHRRRIALALVVCALTGLLVGGAPHRLQVYPNSLTIFSFAEGPGGFFWLAAADGLYRFDGFHYEKVTAYPFVSASSVGFTRDGVLWCASFEGLARLVNGRFEVVAREGIVSMAVTPDAVFFRNSNGLVRADLHGSITNFGHTMRRDLVVDPAGQIWGVCIRPQTVCWIDPAKPRELHSTELPPGLEYQQAARAVDGKLWAADATHALLIENGREISRQVRAQSRETARPAPLLEGRNGQVWFLGERIVGLNSPMEFQDRAENARYSPISGYEDSRGHVWVAEQGRGLIEWIPNPKWERWFPEDFAKEPIVQITRNLAGAIVIATEKNIYRIGSRHEHEWMPLTKQRQWFESILPLEDGGFLATTHDGPVERIAADGRVVERLKDVLNGERYREIIRDTKGRIWIGARNSLYRVEGNFGSLRLRAEALPDMPQRQAQDPVDLEIDPAGHLWAGYTAGLAWLDDRDQWGKIATDRAVTQVRSFALAGDEIWVTHRRSGAFSRLHKQGSGWRVTEFAASAGYTPINSYFIKRDSRGWIWRGSPDGVFISDGVHVEPNDWIHLNLDNGLAANEMSLYGFFEDRDGSVWIAGDEGLTHMMPDPAWFRESSTRVPRVTMVEADGRQFSFPSPLPSRLASDTKVLRILAGSMGAPRFRDARLRYRLLPEMKDWKLSRDGMLEFRNLRSRTYTLELGYAGDTGSASRYELQIGTVVSWQWPAGVLVAAGLLIPVIRYAPWLERTRFRAAKGWFLLRRRFGRQMQSSSDAAVEAVDQTGQTLADRYRLTRLISRGGFAVVYEARDLRQDQRPIAVKILNRAAGGESRMRDRFAHEVAALRSIDHPGVVKILDSWISPAGEPCLAMPLLEGSTLRNVLNGGAMDRARAARIALHAGEALSEVHRRGIVHRDLKPENIMLISNGADERAVIVDFGTAGLRTGEYELAATTLMAGSFYYMAPERLTGHYSPASDVFALGVIVLEMVTGKRLNDLKSSPSDESFTRELEKMLRSKRLAELLAPAFDPRPQRRPVEIGEWAREVGEAIRG